MNPDDNTLKQDDQQENSTDYSPSENNEQPVTITDEKETINSPEEEPTSANEDSSGGEQKVSDDIISQVESDQPEAHTESVVVNDTEKVEETPTLTEPDQPTEPHVADSDSDSAPAKEPVDPASTEPADSTDNPGVMPSNLNQTVDTANEQQDTRSEAVVKDKNQSQKLLIGIIVFVAILLCAVVVFMYVSSNENVVPADSENTQSSSENQQNAEQQPLTGDEIQESLDQNQADFESLDDEADLLNDATLTDEEIGL